MKKIKKIKAWIGIDRYNICRPFMYWEKPSKKDLENDEWYKIDVYK